MKTTVVLVLLTLLVALAFWAWTPDIPRATLEQTYLARRSDLMDVAGTTLHVRDSGDSGDRGARDAPAVILVHGFGSSLQTWDAWLPVLQHHHRVIRFDLPGNGLSPPDSTGDYTDKRSVALLLALQDQLGLAHSSIVGHSIGGRIAWTFAAQHPDRVDKLVLVAPDGFASPGFAYGQAPEVPRVLQLMRFVLPKPLLRANLAPAYADPAALSDATTTRYFELMRAPGARQAMLQRMAQTVLVDPVPLLRSIRAPTLLLWGERDAMIPMSNADDYLRALPQAQLTVMPGAGHLPQEETPAPSVAAVAAFLDAR